MAKKVISVLISILLVLGIMAPVATAVETEENYPVIYISGYGGYLYKNKYNYGEGMIYPLEVDLAATLKDAIKPFLTELANGYATGNWDKYCDEIYNIVAPIFEEIVIDPDGTVKNNTGVSDGYSGKDLSYDRYSGGMVYLPYDWRLSPETAAAKLSLLVDDVIKYHGGKVNIVARCFGGNILSSYLQNDPDAAKKINEVIFFIPSTEGMDLIGSLFSGKIDLVSENFDTYAEEMLKYEEFIEDEMVRDLLTVMLTIFEQATLLELGADFLEDGLEEIKNNIIPRLIRATYGSFPSFWSMVPAEYLDDAIEFVYNTPELKAEYEGTINKALSYRKNVQLNSRANLLSLSDKIKINVVSKYNLPLPPLFEGCNKMSDGNAETYYTSFGATAADYGKTLTGDYIASMSEADKRFLSPDEKIDASTCLLPETTWFIKNSYHNHFPACVDVFFNTILTTDMDVFSNEDYPQYIDAEVEGEHLVPVVGKDKEVPAAGSDEAKMNMLFKFILTIIEFFKRLFTKA